MTPDKTIIESKHVHDYRSHIDSITGETYCVDGGLDYFRTSLNKIPATCLCVTTEDPFELQREAFTWGSYGKNGNEPKHYIKLKDMTTQHIVNILLTQDQIKGTYVAKLFKQELKYRAKLWTEINELIGDYDDE